MNKREKTAYKLFSLLLILSLAQISSDDRAKINDFGLARIRPRANASLHTQCGTPNWQGKYRKE